MSLERSIARKQWLASQPPGHSRRKRQVKKPQRMPFKIWALKTFRPAMYAAYLDAFLARAQARGEVAPHTPDESAAFNDACPPAEFSVGLDEARDTQPPVKTGMLGLGDVRKSDGRSWVVTAEGGTEQAIADGITEGTIAAVVDGVPTVAADSDEHEVTYVNPNPAVEQLNATDRQIEEDDK